MPARGSLGLTAYRTLSARRTAPAFEDGPKRPEGALIWLHAAETGNLTAIADLARAIVIALPHVHVLLTSSELAVMTHADDGIITQVLATDHPIYAEAFVAHWRPNVLIWTWGGLMPNLVIAAREAGAHMILTDAARDGFESRKDRWLPEVPRRLLSHFDTVIARSKPAFHRLAQLGHPPARIEHGQPMRPQGTTLSAADSDVSEVTSALGGRPCWLAAMVHGAELITVLAAHRQALKASYRLLLILLIKDPSDGDRARAAARERGLNVALWTEGEMPQDSAQVLLADATDELGLWLRLAPVVFAGGSLQPDTPDMDPHTIAAHGVALIYGPYVQSHGAGYKRLLDAGAARIVSDQSSLGLAVTQMIVPDRAAAMAMAGWNVLTEGAAATDRLVSELTAYLPATKQAD
ncbi:MAG: glycosyltransferase N-terminal domain-containing protein [Pseudomonadota bacterium]